AARAAKAPKPARAAATEPRFSSVVRRWTSPRSAVRGTRSSLVLVGAPRTVGPGHEAAVRAADPRAPTLGAAARRARSGGELDQLPEHVVGARLRLLDPRDVVGARDDHVV